MPAQVVTATRRHVWKDWQLTRPIVWDPSKPEGRPGLGRGGRSAPAPLSSRARPKLGRPARQTIPGGFSGALRARSRGGALTAAPRGTLPRLLHEPRGRLEPPDAPNHRRGAFLDRGTRTRDLRFGKRGQIRGHRLLFRSSAPFIGTPRHSLAPRFGGGLVKARTNCESSVTNGSFTPASSHG